MKITGTIKDNVTGNVMPFANVYVKGKQSIGIASDIDGRFILEDDFITGDTVIVGSFLGYNPKEIKASDVNAGAIKLNPVTVRVGEAVISECGKGKIEIRGKCINKYLVIGGSLALLGVTLTIIIGKTKKWF